MRRRNQSLELKEGILQHLQANCIGKARPIRAVELACKFNVNIRDISDAIHSLRMDRVLIGSSKEKPYGYYIPATEEEVKGYLDTYQGELFDMLSVYNRQRRARQAFLDSLRSKDLFQCKPEASGQLNFV